MIIGVNFSDVKSCFAKGLHYFFTLCLIYTLQKVHKFKTKCQTHLIEFNLHFDGADLVAIGTDIIQLYVV